MNKWLFLTLLVSLAMPPPTVDGAATADECPKIILTVVCDSQNHRRCCATYAAEVAGQWGTRLDTLHFKWILTNAKIISGQNSSVIRFEPKGAKGKPVVVKVSVEGLDNWHPICPRVVSLTIDSCKDKKRSAVSAIRKDHSTRVRSDESGLIS